MKSFLPITILSCLLISGLYNKTNAQVPQTEARIDSLMQQYKMVGLSVAVVKKGRVIYTHTFGVKNIASAAPLTDSSLFRIASISKSFSATAVMQLVQAKKLSLNDDVSKLIGFRIRNPKFPEKVITLKMLLSHTSSLNDSRGYFTYDSINPAKSDNWAECYNNYAPGAGYEYCNYNYNIVGGIIERASGERFDHYIKAHILDPLHLYGGYEISALDSSKFATLYEYDSTAKKYTAAEDAYQQRTKIIEQYKMGISTPVFSPTGGMKISAADLAKYMTMHMYYGKYDGTRIISRKSAKTMQRQVSNGEGGYGLAIETKDDLIPGKIMKGHTGSAYGLYSIMFWQPKEKFGIVAITNGMNLVVDEGYNIVTKAAVKILYDGLIK
ncbi:MAG: beta-lactamase family protein [Bacteroidota bacterium]|nr:beta-lactamase family protein [Bacteroidota bacterium]